MSLRHRRRSRSSPWACRSSSRRGCSRWTAARSRRAGGGTGGGSWKTQEGPTVGRRRGDREGKFWVREIAAEDGVEKNAESQTRRLSTRGKRVFVFALPGKFALLAAMSDEPPPPPA